MPLAYGRCILNDLYVIVYYVDFKSSEFRMLRSVNLLSALVTGVFLCRFCEPCMLDPACGFCYGVNDTAVAESSCVPVSAANTETSAAGR